MSTFMKSSGRGTKCIYKRSLLIRGPSNNGVIVMRDPKMGSIGREVAKFRRTMTGDNFRIVGEVRSLKSDDGMGSRVARILGRGDRVTTIVYKDSPVTRRIVTTVARIREAGVYICDISNSPIAGATLIGNAKKVAKVKTRSPVGVKGATMGITATLLTSGSCRGRGCRRAFFVGHSGIRVCKASK